MDKFIHDENLKLYRKVLAETSDEGRRRTILELIREEIARGELPAPDEVLNSNQ